MRIVVVATLAAIVAGQFDAADEGDDGFLIDPRGRGGKKRGNRKNAKDEKARRMTRGEATRIYLNALDRKALNSGEPLDIAFAAASRERARNNPLPQYIYEEIANPRKELRGGAAGVDLNCAGDDCDIPMSLAGIWGYGCWCNFGADLMKGSGPAMNGHDAACQEMQLCLRCAMHDAYTDGNYTCDPKSNEFRSVISFGDRTLEADCTAENPGDICGIHMCMCEMNLINNLLDLVWTSFEYDAAFRHPSLGGDFDADAFCPQNGIGSEIACCGFYPERIPYSINGNRDCCDSDNQIFSELSEQCCDDGVHELGDVC